MTTAIRNPYRVLGVAPDAEWEAIQGAYRALCRKWHPDVNPEGDARMKELNAAYAVLSDPVKRAEYDRSQPRPTDGAERGSATGAGPTSYPPPPPSSDAPPRQPPRPKRPAARPRATFGWYRRLPEPVTSRLLPFLLVLVPGVVVGLLVGRLHLQTAVLVAWTCAGLPAGHRAIQRLSETAAGRMATAAAALSARDRPLHWLLLFLLRWLVVALVGVIAGPVEIALAALAERQSHGGSR